MRQHITNKELLEVVLFSPVWLSTFLLYFWMFCEHHQLLAVLIGIAFISILIYTFKYRVVLSYSKMIVSEFI